MKFKSVNEMDKLSFHDAAVVEWKVEQELITLIVESVIVKPMNSQNGRYEDMYSGECTLRLQNAKISKVVKEGYKYYDANDVLINEIPDSEIPVLEYKKLFQQMKDAVIFAAVPTDENKEGQYQYQFGFDLQKEDDDEEVDTYWVTVTFDKAVAEWDRYCNPVTD